MKRTDGTSPIADVESSISQGSTNPARPRKSKARIVRVAVIGLFGLGGLAGMGMSMRSWRKETHPSLLLASAVAAAAAASSSGRRLAASSSSSPFELFASDDDGSTGSKDNEAQLVLATAARAGILSGGKRGTGLGETPLSSFLKRSAGAELRTLQEDTGGTRQRRLAGLNGFNLYPFRLFEADDNHLSITAQYIKGLYAWENPNLKTRVPMVFRSDGTVHPRPLSCKATSFGICTGGHHVNPYQTDFDKGWGLKSGTSSTGALFGNKMVQLGHWRIAQYDDHHLSIGHSNGQVSWVFKDDNTVYGNAYWVNGWKKDLGRSPTCAFVSRDKSTDYKNRSFLQVGKWRIGTIKQDVVENGWVVGIMWHLAVGHINGNTPRLYSDNGEVHYGGVGEAHPGLFWGFTPWNIPMGTVAGGSTTGCPDPTGKEWGWW